MFIINIIFTEGNFLMKFMNFFSKYSKFKLDVSILFGNYVYMHVCILV